MNRDNCPPWASCKWSVSVSNALVVRRTSSNYDTTRQHAQNGKWYACDVAKEMEKSAPFNSGVWTSDTRGYCNKRSVEHAIFSLRAKFPDAEIIVRRWNKSKTRQWWQTEWRFKPGMPIYKKS